MTFKETKLLDPDCHKPRVEYTNLFQHRISINHGVQFIRDIDEALAIIKEDLQQTYDNFDESLFEVNYEDGRVIWELHHSQSELQEMFKESGESNFDVDTEPDEFAEEYDAWLANSSEIGSKDIGAIVFIDYPQNMDDSTDWSLLQALYMVDYYLDLIHMHMYNYWLRVDPIWGHKLVPERENDRAKKHALQEVEKYICKLFDIVFTLPNYGQIRNLHTSIPEGYMLGYSQWLQAFKSYIVYLPQSIVILLRCAYHIIFSFAEMYDITQELEDEPDWSE